MQYPNSISTKLLLFIPLIVYLLSYTYLAIYHSELIIFNTIVHESGKLTFLEDLLYSAHFLGHIPIHVVISFLFVGYFISLSDIEKVKISWRKLIILTTVLITFTFLAYYHSINTYGIDSTWNYLMQNKQSEKIYGQGGSWTLHLASTSSMVFVIPFYIISLNTLVKRKIVFRINGILYIVIGLIAIFIFTYIVSGNILQTMKDIFSNNRYLAHSVRELATFPLIYFPLVSFFILKETKEEEYTMTKKVVKVFVFLLLTNILLLIFQSYAPITEGIGTLAQKPDFAKNGSLSITYLLSSHYFEHFLDTIFFTLFSLIIFNLSKF